MIRHIEGEMIQKAVMKDQGSTYRGLYCSCQNLCTIRVSPGQGDMEETSYSGETMFATAAATTQVDMTYSFLV